MTIRKQSELLHLLKESIGLATGCTEPAAIAYSSANARKKVKGDIVLFEITVDSYLYKNALNVSIPGFNQTGVKAAVALGLAIGDTEMGLNLLENIGEDVIRKAKEFLSRDIIKLKVIDNCDILFIQSILTSDKGKVRVVTLEKHDNIADISEDTVEDFDFRGYLKKEKVSNPITNYSLDDFIDFSSNIDLAKIEFLKEGIHVNSDIAKAGLDNVNSIGYKFNSLINQGYTSEGPAVYAQKLCSAASYARMSGVQLPVMTSTGSGNHGITLFLTIAAAAEKLNIGHEKMIRALALGQLVNAYIKAHTGALSAMCGCGVAAGIGASCGIVFMMGGNKDKIFGTILNMIGSISGIICDGAKEGCAYKLALASGWAVQSALLSLNDAVVKNTDGILCGEFKSLISNLGYVCGPGMRQTNAAIVEIMQKECV
ncbi:L-cysteine desulfidase family protein [Paramaledivibacter caminithermalis]|uniref:UPF0597 protein SAMN02745912_02818 n=1 Tax=Paramaledivibacter caminithermalis (strain DSM 15212 / CIP 107654 / DViRD3) TaxID=1121301 RepID=A0A1M6R2P9_PARC5|nr:L-serine ammonia-lyase, iron-sulfur-dependent, subunit alpha [Paramaledivibacter caminithermalis]SHK26696.1 L-cysteine desulfidase [Paramaledivibacter caminithermalis DSM 15212]